MAYKDNVNADQLEPYQFLTENFFEYSKILNNIITKKTCQDVVPDASLPDICAYHKSLNQTIASLFFGLPKLKRQIDKARWIFNQQEKFPELMEAVSRYSSSNAGSDYRSPQQDTRVVVPVPPPCSLHHYGAYHKSACDLVDFWSNYLEPEGQFLDETLRSLHLKFPYIVEKYPGPSTDARDLITDMQLTMNQPSLE